MGTMDFDDVLMEVGDRGKYQKQLLVFFLLPLAILYPLIFMNIFFMVSVPDHWCSVPEVVQSNLTIEQQRQLVSPPSDAKCHMYDINYTDYLSSGIYTVPNDTITRPCTNGWEYDKTSYESTAATQWNMVCEDDHYPSFVLTLNSVGGIIGTPIYGALSDRIGRKITFFICLTVTAASSIASVRMTDFTAFVVFITINGALWPSFFQLPSIIVLELVAPEMRTHNYGLTNCAWTFGLCLLPLIAYLSRSWVVLGHVTSAMTLLCFLYWKYLPESPRWLLSQERYDEALTIMKKIGDVNGKSPDPDKLLAKLKILGDKIKKERTVDNVKNSSSDLLKYPQLRKTFIIISICWCAVILSYYALQLNVTNLAGNQFLNFFLTSIAALPGYITCWFLMDKLGRRWVTVVWLLLAGLACMLPVFLSGLPYADVICSMLGKYCTSAAYMTSYQQGAELFPTVVRSLGMGMGKTVCMIATIFVPYLVYLAVYDKAIPFVAIGLTCILAGIAASFLPETLNEPLPQTISDAEEFGKNHKYFSWSSIHFGLTIRSEPLNWSNFGNVSRVVRLLYESGFLLAEMVENDFAVMTTGQVLPEDLITDILIATDVRDDTTDNTLVKMSLPIDSKPRVSNERTTQAFRTHHKPNEDLLYEFRFSSEFVDRLCRGGVRCEVPSIIVKSPLLTFPDHWCSVPEVVHSNFTIEQQRQLVSPPTDAKCHMYDINYTDYLSSGIYTVPNDTITRPCTNGWEYDKTSYESTAATQWNMVCEDDHYPSFVLTLNSVGGIIGTPIYGALSDRIGRKITFFICLTVTAASSIASVLMTDFTAFVVIKTINGALWPSIFQLPSIIVLELVAPGMRTHNNGLTNCAWTFGMCLLPLVAYFSRSWVMLGHVTSAMTILCFLYWKFLPESPRWLLSQERYDEAFTIMKKIGDVNGKSPDPDQLFAKLKILGDKIKKERTVDNVKNSSSDLLKYPQLRKTFIIISICWCAVFLSYFALQLNVTNLAGNEFLNFFLTSIVDIPGYITCWFLMDKLGRRWVTVMWLLMAGVACMLPAFLSGLPYADVICSMLGKYCTSAAYMTSYQQGAELYPTVVRSLGMGMSTTVSLITSIIVPYLVYLAVYDKAIPFVAIGLTCILAGIAASFLPETLNEPLPQTISDAEEFGKNHKYFSWNRRKYLSAEKKVHC